MFITKSNHLSRLSKPPKTWNNRVALLLSTISLTLTSIAQAQTTTPIYSGSGPLAVGGQLGFGQIPLPPTPGVTIADISNNTLDTNIGLGTIGYVGYSNYTYNPTSSALELVNPDFPVLDANLGYSIDFYVLLVNTNTFGSNRAALSLTVISDDGTGIELGFVEGTLTDRVFAQDVNFDNETLSTTGTLDLSLANHFVLQIIRVHSPCKMIRVSRC